MRKVTFQTFADFTSATGTARITRVRAAKKFYEAGYHPARDYWKPLRDRIEVCSSNGWDVRELRTALDEITDEKKHANYEECFQGFSTWRGRKTLKTLLEFRGVWNAAGLEVSVNPELHASMNGVPHVIKLSFKFDPLSKAKLNVALHLLDRESPNGTAAGVLDVRRAKLHVPTCAIDGMDELLEAEAAAFSSLWSAL